MNLNKDEELSVSLLFSLILSSGENASNLGVTGAEGDIGLLGN